MEKWNAGMLEEWKPGSQLRNTRKTRKETPMQTAFFNYESLESPESDPTPGHPFQVLGCFICDNLRHLR
jgi:hypothetical protein